MLQMSKWRVQCMLWMGWVMTFPMQSPLPQATPVAQPQQLMISRAECVQYSTCSRAFAYLAGILCCAKLWTHTVDVHSTTVAASLG